MFLYYKIQSAPEYCNVIYLGVKAKIYIEYRREIQKKVVLNIEGKYKKVVLNIEGK